MTSYLVSSRTNPCPICGRDKDGDCRTIDAGSGVLCHTQQESISDVINGYKWVKRSDKGAGWGVWVKDDGSKPDRAVNFVEKRQYYPYPDRGGNDLVRVVRQKGGKPAFWQEYWIDGEWLSPKRVRERFGEEEGTRIVEAKRKLVPLYRYHNVRAAIDRNEPVLWVEGEKVANALWTLGIPATTTIGGTNSLSTWGDYSEDIKGGKFVLCPDRDAVGIKYANNVAAMGIAVAGWLYAYPQSPIWEIELPSKDGIDIANWIGEGATKEEILGAVEGTARELILPGVEVPSKAEKAAKQSNVIPHPSSEQLEAMLELDPIEQINKEMKALDAAIIAAEEQKTKISDNYLRLTRLLKEQDGFEAVKTREELALAKEELRIIRDRVAGLRSDRSNKRLNSARMQRAHFTSESQSDSKMPAAKRIYLGLRPEYGAKIAWNDLTQKVEIDNADTDLEVLRGEIAIHGNGTDPSPKEDYYLAMATMARENRYHPVKDYLKRCHDTFGATTREEALKLFDEVLTDILGVEADTMSRLYIKRFFINAVARIDDPGFKVDTVLVFQGTQGGRKSTFCRELCPDVRWFTDALKDISHNDSLALIRAKWIVELAELERFTYKNLDGAFKVFLSQGIDEWRAPYAREPVAVARNSIFIATVNRIDFLKDPTGSRRFHIIPGVDEVDIDHLIEIRDILWGAAVSMYKMEPQPTKEDLLLMKKVSSANSVFETDNVWQIAIAEYLEANQNIRSITTRDLLVNVLKFELKDIKRSQEMEVADVMHKIQWKKEQGRINGEKVRFWTRPAQ